MHDQSSALCRLTCYRLIPARLNQEASKIFIMFVRLTRQPCQKIYVDAVKLYRSLYTMSALSLILCRLVELAGTPVMLKLGTLHRATTATRSFSPSSAPMCRKSSRDSRPGVPFWSDVPEADALPFDTAPVVFRLSNSSAEKELGGPLLRSGYEMEHTSVTTVSGGYRSFTPHRRNSLLSSSANGVTGASLRSCGFW